MFFLFLDCGQVASPERGSVKVTGYYYLDTAAFECNPGYQLVGQQKITCQYGGNWSEPFPTCQIKG